MRGVGRGATWKIKRAGPDARGGRTPPSAPRRPDARLAGPARACDRKNRGAIARRERGGGGLRRRPHGRPNGQSRAQGRWGASRGAPRSPERPERDKRDSGGVARPRGVAGAAGGRSSRSRGNLHLVDADQDACVGPEIRLGLGEEVDPGVPLLGVADERVALLTEAIGLSHIQWAEVREKWLIYELIVDAKGRAALGERSERAGARGRVWGDRRCPKALERPSRALGREGAARRGAPPLREGPFLPCLSPVKSRTQEKKSRSRRISTALWSSDMHAASRGRAPVRTAGGKPTPSPPGHPGAAPAMTRRRLKRVERTKAA